MLRQSGVNACMRCKPNLTWCRLLSETFEAELLTGDSQLTGSDTIVEVHIVLERRQTMHFIDVAHGTLYEALLPVCLCRSGPGGALPQPGQPMRSPFAHPAACQRSAGPWLFPAMCSAHRCPAMVEDLPSGGRMYADNKESVAAQVTRLEMSRRYRLRASAPISDADTAAFAALVHDRMTEEVSTPA